MTDSNRIYNEDQHLVYVLYRDGGVPHYVGATTDSRRPYSDKHHARKDHNITSVEIVRESLSLEDASTLEGQLINQYGKTTDGGTLVNVQDGGHGLATEETKTKLSLANKGRAPHNKGKTHSDETRAKMSASQKGRTSNRKGIAMSEEQKAKLSAALKGRKRKPFTEEHKANIRAAKLGGKHKSFTEGATS